MITRISSLYSQKSMLSQLAMNQNKFYELQQQALTGQKINNISDDPVAAIKILGLNDELAKVESYQKNVDMAQAEYEVLDNSLALVLDKLQRVNELAVSASSEQNTQENLDLIKNEVDSILQTIVDLSNTQYNGIYIFSGTNTGTPTYIKDADGNITYGGTPQTGDYKRNVEVSDGMYLTLNAPGDKMFGNYDAVNDTGTGIFKTLTDFSKALETGDFDTLRATINANKDDLEVVTNVRSQYGTYAKKADMSETSLADTSTVIQSDRSTLRDVDTAEIYSSLVQQQYALQASMQITSMSLQPSLLDYI